MKIFVLFICYTAVNSVPIKETTVISSSNKKEKKNDTVLRNSTENELNLESRAGIVDSLNPLNLITPQPQPNKDNGNGQDNSNNNNPLGGIPNVFGNVPQFFNMSNPFEQLFSSQPGGNFLDNIKVFVVGTQGVVMPASAILGGFQNLLQAFGNMGNFAQGLPQLGQVLSNVGNVLPTLPSGSAN